MKKQHQPQWGKLLLRQLLLKRNAVATLDYLPKRSLGSIALVFCFLGCWTSSAQAEGSKEMTANGGDRPFLEYSNGLNAGIVRRTIIKVYVQAGETLNLGSSASGIGSGAINYRKPNNTTGSCPAPGTNNIGKILNRTQEVAGPLPNSNGYQPCVVSVGAGEAGVWEIDFVSPNLTGIPGNTGSPNPTPITANGTWSAQASDRPFVTAWDVMRNTSGNTILGRVFAKYLSLNMGGNSKSLSSKVTVLTRDGYHYAIGANGLDPFGFIFYADDLGFTDTSGKSLYR